MSRKVIVKGLSVVLYFRLYAIFKNKPVNDLFSFSIQNNSQLWHNRLGYPNSETLSILFNSCLMNKSMSLRNYISFDCSVCKLGKSKALSFSTTTKSSSKCLDLIHSDVWGIAPVISHNQYKYFVTFIDDYNQFTWVYFLH